MAYRIKWKEGDRPKFKGRRKGQARSLSIRKSMTNYNRVFSFWKTRHERELAAASKLATEIATQRRVDAARKEQFAYTFGSMPWHDTSDEENWRVL